MYINPDLLDKIYFYSAIVATIVFLLKTSFPMDSGSEVSADFTSMTDTDASFNVFTIESISAFVMCFGWMGYFSYVHFHYELKTSLIAAVVAGIIGMGLYIWLISLARKLEHIPSYNLSDMTGKEGKSYVHFEPNGTGKIQIEFNSRLETLDARNNKDEAIEPFVPIKVVKVENDVVYIEKV